MEQLTDIKVVQARIEEKCDGIIARLDKLNGSVATLFERTNRLENDIIRMDTERGVFVKVAKPVLIALCVAVMALVGREVPMKEIAELFAP